MAERSKSKDPQGGKLDKLIVDAGQARTSDAAAGGQGGAAPGGTQEGDWRENSPAASVERSGVLDHDAPSGAGAGASEPGVAESVERMLEEDTVQGRPRADAGGAPGGGGGGGRREGPNGG